MNRREFLENVALILATVPITIATTRCGTTSVTVGGVTATIAENHGHVGTLSETQLTAAAAVEIDITGASAHAHTISLTAAHVVAIQAGTSVSVESTSGTDRHAHTHLVTFSK